nr:MAG TPA: hypothetical protein [Caudoviricetes sp.]
MAQEIEFRAMAAAMTTEQLTTELPKVQALIRNAQKDGIGWAEAVYQAEARDLTAELARRARTPQENFKAYLKEQAASPYLSLTLDEVLNQAWTLAAIMFEDLSVEQVDDVVTELSRELENSKGVSAA